MDFIFGATVKDKVFVRKPRTDEGIIQFVLEACQETDFDKSLLI